MQFFIKAAEVWLPDTDELTLKLSSWYYGEYEELASTSTHLTFAFGEGLPGQTWAQQRPLVWTELGNGLFKRSAEAERAGIACALSIPIYAGDFLQAVVVLFCGKGTDVTGAVEVWSQSEDSATALKLAEGYYGDLERFEWISRRLSVSRGRGLPGVAWETDSPFVVDDLASSNNFLRARNAAESGITTGLAVPLANPGKVPQILTFLSARGTPIARRFEIWRSNGDQGALEFETGFCESGTDLGSKYRGQAIRQGEGPLGIMALTGRPVIAGVEGGDAVIGKEWMLALPVIVGGRLASIVVLVF